MSDAATQAAPQKQSAAENPDTVQVTPRADEIPSWQWLPAPGGIVCTKAIICREFEGCAVPMAAGLTSLNAPKMKTPAQAHRAIARTAKHRRNCPGFRSTRRMPMRLLIGKLNNK